MESPISTQRLATTELQQAASLLQQGGVVAFPTETVYGLGADAFAPRAIRKIFQAKGRPSDNPLIAHIANENQLDLLAIQVPQLARDLMAAFWPGPLTLVLKKQPAVPNEVTAGLDTVAIRMPRDPLARELIRIANTPLVAPSANRSGKPSATTWQAVLEDLDGCIDAVICGDPTQLGIESTVVDVTTEIPVILRHGSITEEMIAGIVRDTKKPVTTSLDFEKRSPGTRHRHYQPQAQVRIYALKPETSNPNHEIEPVTPWAWIGLQPSPTLLGTVPMQVLVCDSIEAYAANLYAFFRTCDSHGIRTIYCEQVPPNGLGRALMDRLTRAASS
jgi:L-threonylcarbamoyladenylate synthase